MRQGLSTSSGIDVSDDGCYICHGLMLRLNDVFMLVEDALKDYEFRSFLIGATLPQDMLEREDEIRARLKVKGTESIKSNITRELGMMLSSKGYRVDYERPDVDIHVDLISMKVNVKARPIYLLARYRKSIRGLKQKGYENSIESIVRDWVIREFNARDARFLWVGGEDKDSLVDGEGRPFFIKVVDARKRSGYANKLSSDGIDVTIVREVDCFPRQIRFMSMLRLYLESESEQSIMDRVREVISRASIDVRFIEDGGKYVVKRIHAMYAREGVEAGMVEVDILVDGGFTVRRFAEGFGVEPSMYDLFGSVRLRYFDVLDVRMVGAD
ncbi:MULTISPECIES: THUMP domain-containing protein [Candidatus Nitrosocaldus]|jgi:tRNA pseudouridine synthase 10|nr:MULTISPECIES: THUMP domain-containing protein [Candidatus Nitrosocaldus]